MLIVVVVVVVVTSLLRAIWEEGRVAAKVYMYAVKSPLVTMARLKFAPKSTPFCGPIPKSHHLPQPWTHPTYDAKVHPDPIRRISNNALDRLTHTPTDRPTDRPRESLTTIGCYASNESNTT